MATDSVEESWTQVSKTASMHKPNPVFHMFHFKHHQVVSSLLFSSGLNDHCTCERPWMQESLQDIDFEVVLQGNFATDADPKSCEVYTLYITVL